MKAIDPRSTDATCMSGPEIYIDSVLFPSHHFIYLTDRHVRPRPDWLALVRMVVQ